MTELEQLVEVSRRYGADSRFVIAGGGNTSYKDNERLWVKASGHALATIGEDGFAVLDRALLNKMGEKVYSTDAAEREEQVKNDLADACITKDRRPSVETSLHNAMSARFIVHLHPTAVNGVMCSNNAEKACAELFGADALYIPYTDPGYTLFKKVYDEICAFKAAKGHEPKVIMLQNHGVFVGADTVAEIDAIYADMLSKIEARVQPLDMTPTEVCDCAVEVVPAIRSILSRGGRGDKIIRIVKNALVDKYIDSQKAFAAVAAPFTPDGIVYCKSAYLYIDGADAAEKIAGAEAAIEKYVSERGYTPKVLAIKGIGLLAVGDSAKAAGIVAEVFTDCMKVAHYAASFGGEHPMTKAQIDFIDNWEVENYRRKVSASGSHGRAENKIFIVTGAAQGFGEGIARCLVEEGANIVVADLNEVTGEATVANLNSLCKNNRVTFFKTDVTSYDCIVSLVKDTVCNFGGVDAFISNAGIAIAGDLTQMVPEKFDLVTKINYHGFFYCSKAVAPVLKAQNKYDPERFGDIIQINSKSGLEGSKANFAYAGSKFGGLGLVQSFAMELAPFRIKVNGICPGNFLDGPLWSDPVKGLYVQYLNAGKVPGAKTVDDVREYYLSKVPMHKGCNPKDVTKGVLYLIEQTCETGQALPITGGQIMLK
jgi:rhamnose utilization protein RhaD (predicted bifunctional aldolase and dehydrogenase)/NAD(P)-dependent dehydrogenase (short-subunit alcohol dehydrogenase family)